MGRLPFRHLISGVTEALRDASQSLRPGNGHEVVLCLEIAGFNEEPVVYARLQRVWYRALHGRFHPFDVITVNKIFDRHGIRGAGQVPDRMREFVGLDIADRNDFDGSEPQLAAETEDDGVDGGVVSRAGALASKK